MCSICIRCFSMKLTRDTQDQRTVGGDDALRILPLNSPRQASLKNGWDIGCIRNLKRALGFDNVRRKHQPLHYHHRPISFVATKQTLYNYSPRLHEQPRPQHPGQSLRLPMKHRTFIFVQATGHAPDEISCRAVAGRGRIEAGGFPLKKVSFHTLGFEGPTPVASGS